jgi:outer membrane protein OmpA-like peptidoglycan-associated protein
VKKLLPLLLFLLATPAFSQKILWANELLGFSSEERDMYYSPKFRAIQILGKPNVLPTGIMTPCAWAPSGANIGTDWISVGFVEGMKIKQVAVCENFNPGGISQVFGINSDGEEILIYENSEAPTKEDGRIWSIIIPETTFEVFGIKLMIDHTQKRGQKHIDAIAISDSEEPIQVLLNTIDWGEEKVVLESLGYAINSEYGEVAPIISPDGKELYFTRINHPDNIHRKDDKIIKQDIWHTQKRGKTWNAPQNLGTPLNDEEDNAVTCISADGKTLFVLNAYSKTGKTKVGLSKSRRTINGWSYPEKILIDDFQALSHDEIVDGTKIEKTYTEFSITPDEKVIVMGLKRSQTYGERDIYASFRQSNGSYSRPRSLGPVINTADMEGSPFLAADTKTLYFMSKGHLGYGNGDIFVSKRLDDTWTNWSEPLNLGPPINTSEWNGYINVPAASDYGFVSSKRSKNESHDIYRVTMPPQLRPEPLAVVTGRPTNLMTKKTIPAEITLRSVNGDSVNTVSIDLTFDPEEDGEYKFILPIGQDYVFTAKQRGYIGIMDSLILRREKGYREIRFDLSMTEIKAGQKMILNQLFFERAKYEIKEESFDELKRIINLMKEYPSMEVMLEGHTDNQGDLLKNVQLAKNRVEAVKSYLMEKGGIESARISVKSWGPTRPISSNASEGTRKKNRRVEFTIVKL